MRRLLGRIGIIWKQMRTAPTLPTSLPFFFFFFPSRPSSHWAASGTALPGVAALATLPRERPLAPILLYRSGVAAGDTAMGEAMQPPSPREALRPATRPDQPRAIPSLTAELAALIGTRKPALIVTATTAFLRS